MDAVMERQIAILQAAGVQPGHPVGYVDPFIVPVEHQDLFQLGAAFSLRSVDPEDGGDQTRLYRHPVDDRHPYGSFRRCVVFRMHVEKLVKRIRRVRIDQLPPQSLVVDSGDRAVVERDIVILCRQTGNAFLQAWCFPWRVVRYDTDYSASTGGNVSHFEQACPQGIGAFPSPGDITFLGDIVVEHVVLAGREHGRPAVFVKFHESPQEV